MLNQEYSATVDAVSVQDAHLTDAFAHKAFEFDLEFRDVVPSNLVYERDLPYLTSGWRLSLGPEMWDCPRCWISCDWEW